MREVRREVKKKTCSAAQCREEVAAPRFTLNANRATANHAL